MDVSSSKVYQAYKLESCKIWKESDKNKGYIALKNIFQKNPRNENAYGYQVDYVALIVKSRF